MSGPVSVNAPPHSEVCFLFWPIRLVHARRPLLQLGEPVITWIRTRVLGVATSALYH